LKTLMFLSTIGRTISGHPNELSKQGFGPATGRNYRKSKSWKTNTFFPQMPL
jgi:hypothetical protein